MSKETKNTLSIYLIKEDIVDKADILIEDVEPLEQPNNRFIYYKNSKSDVPTWVKSFFKDEETLVNKLFNSSSRAIILRRIQVDEEGNERIFAIPFGYGKYLLKDDVIEERFGLRTVVNLIGENNIRSINKTSISHNNKLSKEQMPKESTIRDFGFDTNGDLINGITGKSIDTDFIEGNVTGTDAFQASIPYNIDNIDEFLKEIYQVFLKDDYKNSFEWIDHITPVKSKNLINILDELLFESIEEDDEKFYMAIPEVVEFEKIKGFKIPNVTEFQTDIELKVVKESFRGGLRDISQFKNKYINAIGQETEEIRNRFNSYRCFVGEIDYDSKSYIINDGKWYQIEKNYVDYINRTYENIELSDIELNDAEGEVWENTYNKEVADSDKDYYYLLDAKNVSYGGGRSRIEICDLLTIDNKLIHVKSYGGSSMLSHLFNQGVVSAELIKSDEEFIEAANKKINKDNFKLSQDKKYEVIYAIISKYDDKRPTIPFFSRVSINNAVRRLQNMDYKVSLKRIKRNITGLWGGNVKLDLKTRNIFSLLIKYYEKRNNSAHNLNDADEIRIKTENVEIYLKLLDCDYIKIISEKHNRIIITILNNLPESLVINETFVLTAKGYHALKQLMK